MSEIHFTDRVDLEGVGRPILTLAARLRKIHGDVTVSHSETGIHLNFASPARLELDGEVELRKKHLALNADKFLISGPWARRRGTYDPERSAMCMKSGKPYSVTELLTMEPLEKRGFKRAGLGVITTAPRAHLIDDGNGHKIPDHPGLVIPVTELPDTHAAIQYLRYRNFDPVKLYEQFRCSYCVEEAPEGAEYGRFYKRMPGGWRDTPQGRIIFYADQGGVQVGWQARLLERVVGMQKETWHPYRMAWETTHVRKFEDGKPVWDLIPELGPETIAFSSRKREWEPSKYKTAFGAVRNRMMLGFDAAVRANAGVKDPACLLVEGPLDAARLGAPAIATLGKFMSKYQAILLASSFRRVGVVADKDAGGEKLISYAKKNLQGLVKLEIFNPPVKAGEDPGDMHPLLALKFAETCIERLGC